MPYIHDPDSLSPALAGLAAGAIGAIVAAVVSLPFRAPDQAAANTLSLTVVSVVIGLAGGDLWRRLRATSNAGRSFLWAQVGGFFVALAAIALVDQFFLGNLLQYATPVAVVIFASVGLLTPMLARSHLPVWSAIVVVVLAVAVGLGLFGRGNTASEDLGFHDLGPGSQVVLFVVAGAGPATSSSATS